MPFKTKTNEKTNEVENECFPKYFLADTEEEANSLLKDFDYTLNLLAYKYARLTGLSEDDLKQEGIIGLARANRDFDFKRSEQFKIFAIYKIKDALTEYVASQSLDVSVPQYLIGARNLIGRAYKFLVMLSIETNGGYVDIWNKANSFVTPDDIEPLIVDGDAEVLRHVRKELTKVLVSLENLASRARTDVKQLLERAENSPSVAGDDIYSDNYESGTHLVDSSENNILDSITTAALIEEIKGILKEDEYNLLVAHYVEGKTVRELEAELGIKAASITVRIHKITEAVRKRMMNNECVKDLGGS